MAATRSDSSIHFTILRHYGVLSTESGGWTKELNLVSWNNREAKYDIRSWSPDKKKMGRGITMTGEECGALRTLLNTRFPGDIPASAPAKPEPAPSTAARTEENQEGTSLQSPAV